MAGWASRINSRVQAIVDVELNLIATETSFQDGVTELTSVEARNVTASSHHMFLHPHNAPRPPPAALCMYIYIYAFYTPFLPRFVVTTCAPASPIIWSSNPSTKYNLSGACFQWFAEHSDGMLSLPTSPPPSGKGSTRMWRRSRTSKTRRSRHSPPRSRITPRWTRSRSKAVTGPTTPYGTFRPNFHHFDRFELDLRGHTRARGAALSCLRLKSADMVLIRRFYGHFSSSGLAIVTNPEILAVHQDPAVKPYRMLWQSIYQLQYGKFCKYFFYFFRFPSPIFCSHRDISPVLVDGVHYTSC